MKEFRFRTPTEYQLNPERVSRESGLIAGIVAMQEGEARGHGVLADAKTLQMMADLAREKGEVRGRFGHPGISENATGKQVSVNRNFRIVGDKLVHDWYAFEPARKSPAFPQDPIEYIFDVAEENPAMLGESVVIWAAQVWPMPDGSEAPDYDWSSDVPDDDPYERDSHLRPIDALTEIPVLRPLKFSFVDIVSEGALTPEGMFSANVPKDIFSGSSAYISQIFHIVDEWRDQYGIPLEMIPEKVDRILSEYTHTRSDKAMARRKKRGMSASKEIEPLEVEVEVEDGDDGSPTDLIDDESTGSPSFDSSASESPEISESIPDNSEELETETDEAVADAHMAEAAAILEELSQPKEVDPIQSQLAELKAFNAGLLEQLEGMENRLSAMSQKYVDTAQTLSLALNHVRDLSLRVDALAGEPVVSETVKVAEMRIAQSPRPPRSFSSGTAERPVESKEGSTRFDPNNPVQVAQRNERIRRERGGTI